MCLIPIYCMFIEATYQLKVLFSESTKSDFVPVSLPYFFVNIGTALWHFY